MARDPVAQPIQGPDNGSGNPLAVNATPVGTTAVNLTQIAGTAAGNFTFGGVAYLRQGFIDTNGIPIVFISANSTLTRAMMGVEQDGNQCLGIQSAANAPAVITIVPPGAAYVRVKTVTCNFFGANAAVNLVVTDGITQMFFIVIPGGQAVPLHFPFIDGGLLGAQGATVTITLPAGGAGIFGNLSASWKYW